MKTKRQTTSVQLLKISFNRGHLEKLLKPFQKSKVGTKAKDKIQLYKY